MTMTIERRMALLAPPHKDRRGHLLKMLELARAGAKTVTVYLGGLRLAEHSMPGVLISIHPDTVILRTEFGPAGFHRRAQSDVHHIDTIAQRGGQGIGHARSWYIDGADSFTDADLPPKQKDTGHE